jgi:hypothetical protein
MKKIEIFILLIFCIPISYIFCACHNLKNKWFKCAPLTFKDIFSLVKELGNSNATI